VTSSDSQNTSPKTSSKGSGTGIEISVKTQYLARESHPDKQSFAFSYTITITNLRQEPVQLLGRHWIINDQNNQRKEVKGKGVVGKQPVIQPGTSFIYSSGAVITTEIGDMQGSYTMQSSSGELFEATIPHFLLAPPMSVH
jgi:ApaG protein